MMIFLPVPHHHLSSGAWGILGEAHFHLPHVFTDASCFILDCSSKPHLPSFHCSQTLQLLDFGWRPRSIVRSFDISGLNLLLQPAYYFGWLSGNWYGIYMVWRFGGYSYNSLGVLASVLLSGSIWLWLTFMHLYRGWPVGYPGNRSWPVYLLLCPLVPPLLQSGSTSVSLQAAIHPNI